MHNGRVIVWMMTATFFMMILDSLLAYLFQSLLHFRISDMLSDDFEMMFLLFFLLPVMVAGACAIIYDVRFDRDARKAYFEREVKIIALVNLISVIGFCILGAIA